MKEFRTNFSNLKDFPVKYCSYLRRKCQRFLLFTFSTSFRVLLLVCWPGLLKSHFSTMIFPQIGENVSWGDMGAGLRSQGREVPLNSYVSLL